MNEYSSETLCNLYLWLRRRLDFFRCAVDNTMGQNTMAFLMFSCLRGVGSSRRSLAACAFDACIPRWCMALLLRLALLPALMSSEHTLAFFGLTPAPRNIHDLADAFAREWNRNPLSRM